MCIASKEEDPRGKSLKYFTVDRFIEDFLLYHITLTCVGKKVEKMRHQLLCFFIL